MESHELENIKREPSYEHISLTAKLVAYMRIFSDISYSEEISSMTKSDEVAKGKYGYQESIKDGSAVLESRFKAVSNLINRTEIKNVLEIAAGVSPRGLIMTEDPAMTYVETDLPEMIEEKKALIKDILERKETTRPNLFTARANALDEVQLQAAANLTSGELAIAQEGLFVYMPRQDQKKVAENVRKILKARGGAWITDISLKSELMGRTDKKREETVKLLQQEAKINFMDNAFESDDEVVTFFESAGFSVRDKIRLLDLKNSLVSPQAVGGHPGTT